METIKNYLDGMFASLPNTPEVKKAKRELYQMMEDKYNELIEEGRSDNEAVGIVISEFGNLEELSESLGIKGVKEEYNTDDVHMVCKEEAIDFLAARRTYSFMNALGIFACILAIPFTILTGSFTDYDALPVCTFFGMCAIGVVILVCANVKIGLFNYLFKSPSRLDCTTEAIVLEEDRKYTSSFALRLTLGIILCVVCWIPCVIIDEVTALEYLSDAFSPAALFFFVAVGVFLIVQTSTEKNSYALLLSFNGTPTMQYVSKGKDIPDYADPVVDVIMHIFWPAAACIYFSWSFISFRWDISWIVWPVAGVAFAILKAGFKREEK